jgi:hypothetical protein
VAGTGAADDATCDGVDDDCDGQVDEDCEVNNPPSADAGPDQADRPLGIVQLDGTGSTDPDGDEITYQWSIIDEPYVGAGTLVETPGAPASPTLDIDGYGTYEVELEVCDEKGACDADTVMITTEENVTPVAKAGDDRTADQYAEVCLDGSESSDPNGDDITYKWVIKSRPAGSVAQLDDDTAVDPCFTPDETGDYGIQLVVNDGVYDSEADTVKISVEGNVPAIADAGVDQTATVDEPVCLDGGGSYDPDNGPSPITYSWSMISSPETSTAELDDGGVVDPCFTPDKEGEYVVQLIVNDGEDDSGPDTVVINAGKGVLGDLDGDGDTDKDDMMVIMAALNSPADGPDDPRDLDGDGVITVLDARKLVLFCTRPGCATE